MEIGGFAMSCGQTNGDSNTNESALPDHFLTTLEKPERATPSLTDLALMPPYRRNLMLRYCIGERPSDEEIQAAWLAFHGKFSGDARYVYFVQRGDDGPIKIGLAKNVARRVAGLQTSCAERLVTLGFCRGDRDMEREYHARFAEYRISGEWFDAADAVICEALRLADLPKAMRK